MNWSDFVKKLQQGMNAQGESLTVDGDPGPRTRAALAKFDVAMNFVRQAPPPPAVIVKPATGDEAVIMATLRVLTPWVFDCMTMLGWDEVTHDKQLTALCWPATKDCRGLKSVVGRSNAWCSGLWCGIMKRLGLPHTASGSAASWRGWGESCDYVFGAFLPLRHASMSNHICIFLWWIDKKKRIAACLGGNQGNRISIAAYNLSGNAAGHEEVMTGPRWPAGKPRTAEPFQPTGWKVGTKIGASTR